MTQEDEKRNYWTGNSMSYKVPGHYVLFTHDKNSDRCRVVLVGLKPPNPDFKSERSLKEHNIIESEFIKGLLILGVNQAIEDFILGMLSYGRSVSLAVVDDHSTIKLHDEVLCENERTLLVGGSWNFAHFLWSAEIALPKVQRPSKAGKIAFPSHQQNSFSQFYNPNSDVH